MYQCVYVYGGGEPLGFGKAKSNILYGLKDNTIHKHSMKKWRLYISVLLLVTLIRITISCVEPQAY